MGTMAMKGPACGDEQSSGAMAARVAVLLPCLDEEATIAEVVAAFRRTLPDARIHVCDNGSDDDTAQAAAIAGASVIAEPRRGKGRALGCLFREVDADIYVTADGDGTYDAASAGRLVSTLQERGLDMLVAAREGADAHAWTPLRRLGNRLFSALARWRCGARVHDLLSGYRVFSRRFVDCFPARSEGFEIETEMTLFAASAGLAWEEIECPYFARPKGSASKLKAFRDGFRILRTLLQRAPVPRRACATAEHAAGAVPVSGLQQASAPRRGRQPSAPAAGIGARARARARVGARVGSPEGALRGALRGAGLTGAVTLTAVVVFLVLNWLAVRSDPEPVAEALRASYAHPERTIEDSPERFNDCLLGLMTLDRGGSTWELVVSPRRVYRFTRPQRPCEALRQRLEHASVDDADYLTVFYHQYWAGQRVLLQALLPRLGVDGLRGLLRWLTFGLLGLGLVGTLAMATATAAVPPVWTRRFPARLRRMLGLAGPAAEGGRSARKHAAANGPGLGLARSASEGARSAPMHAQEGRRGLAGLASDNARSTRTQAEGGRPELGLTGPASEGALPAQTHAETDRRMLGLAGPVSGGAGSARTHAEGDRRGLGLAGPVPEGGRSAQVQAEGGWRGLGLPAPVPGARDMGRGRRQALFQALALAAVFGSLLLFLDLDDRAGSFTTGASNVLTFAVLLAVPTLRIAYWRPNSQVVLCAAFGALIAYHELLFGSALIGFAVLLLALAAAPPPSARPSERTCGSFGMTGIPASSDDQLAGNSFDSGLSSSLRTWRCQLLIRCAAAYAGSLSAVFLLRVLLAELVFREPVLFKFWDQLAFRLYGAPRSSIHPDIDPFYSRRPALERALERAGDHLGSVGLGSPVLALVLIGVTAATLIGAALYVLRHWWTLEDPWRWAGILAAGWSVPAWYAVLFAHTLAHVPVALRLLALPYAAAAALALGAFLFRRRPLDV